jgi:hypothetical protein
MVDDSAEVFYFADKTSVCSIEQKGVGMGYYIKKLPGKKSKPGWKVQFISYKKEDTKKSTASKPKREWDIPKARWIALGFNTFLTIEEAKARAKQLNTQSQLKRQEEQIQKIAEKSKATQKRYDAVLPYEFVTDFESRFIRKRDRQTAQGLRKIRDPTLLGEQHSA